MSAREQMSIRLEPEILERADRLVEVLQREPLTSGLQRADVLRAALAEGLALLEKKHAPRRRRR